MCISNILKLYALRTILRIEEIFGNDAFGICSSGTLCHLHKKDFPKTRKAFFLANALGFKPRINGFKNY